MKNRIIKEALFKNDLKQYQLAEIMGIHEASLSRKLRNELSEEEQLQMVRMINSLRVVNSKCTNEECTL